MTDAEYVHGSAVVDDGAVIGEGTKVWPFCHIMSGARIGRSCVLGQNVFVGNGVTIGDHCKIQNNVSIYEGVVLEDYVFCGPSMVFTNVKEPRSAFPHDRGYAPTLVRRGATIGANATIVCGVTIGVEAFVAAGAVVTRDVKAHELVGGVPAAWLGWVCQCGMRLRFDDKRATCACKRTYAKVAEGIRALT